MHGEKPIHSLIMAIITAAVFGLILAIFGRSEAGGRLTPVHGAPAQAGIKSHNVRVVINNGSPRTEAGQIFVTGGDTDREAGSCFILAKQATLSELNPRLEGRECAGEDDGAAELPGR